MHFKIDLGYASDCGGNELHDVKALDFELNLPDVLAETREQVKNLFLDKENIFPS